MQRNGGRRQMGVKEGGITFHRGEPSEELNCTLLAGVIAKTPWLRKQYIVPQSQLRNIILRWRNPHEWRQKKNQLILKASYSASYRSLGSSERPCLISCLESWGGWGKISGLITAVCVRAGVHNDMNAAEKYKYTCSHIWKSNVWWRQLVSQNNRWCFSLCVDVIPGNAVTLCPLFNKSFQNTNLPVCVISEWLLMHPRSLTMTLEHKFCSKLLCQAMLRCPKNKKIKKMMMIHNSTHT